MHGSLWESLALARREGVAPYVIASNRTLREIALLRARALQELESAHGIGPAKGEKSSVVRNGAVAALLRFR